MSRKKYYLISIILVCNLSNEIVFASDDVDPYRRPPAYEKGSPEWAKQKKENDQRYAEIQQKLATIEAKTSDEDLPVVYVQQIENGKLTPAYYRRFAKTVYLWDNLTLARDEIPYKKASIRPLPILKLHEKNNDLKIDKIYPEIFQMKGSEGVYHIGMYDKERGIFYQKGKSKAALDGKKLLNRDEISSICILKNTGGTPMVSP